MSTQRMTQAVGDRMEAWWRRIWNLIVDSALRLLPPFAHWRHRAAQRNHELGVDAQSKGDTTAAEFHFRKAISQDPRNSDYYCDLGRVYYEGATYTEAEKQFKKALKYNYDNLQALKGLAYSQHALGELSEAVYAYLRYIQLNDKDADVFMYLGIALHSTGKYYEALRYYGEAEKLNPKNAVIPENRGRALYSLGKIDEAVGSLLKALELNPNNPQAHRFLGLALEAQGNMEKSLQSYLKAVELDPENGNAHLDASRLLTQMNRLTEALQQSRTALKNFEAKGDLEGTASAYGNLGWDYFRLDDWGNSVETSMKALEINPDLFGARFNLALALLHDGRREDAIAEYQKGMNRVSSAADLKYSAIDDLQEALKRNPQLPGGLEILGILERRREELKEKRRASNVNATLET